MVQYTNTWYIVVSDNSGDYYVIPEDKHQEWVNFLDNLDETWNGHMPEWSYGVGGWPSDVKFRNWEARYR